LLLPSSCFEIFNYCRAGSSEARPARAAPQRSDIRSAADPAEEDFESIDGTCTFLTNNKRTKMGDLPDIFKCPVCFDCFDSDLSLFPVNSIDQRRESRLPILSHQCPHHICASCLHSWQLRAVSKRAKFLPKWFRCPCCQKKTAFNAEDMEIDTTFVQCLFLIQNQTQASGAAAIPPHVGEGDQNPTAEADYFESTEFFLEQGSARRQEECYLYNDEFRNKSSRIGAGSITVPHHFHSNSRTDTRKFRLKLLDAMDMAEMQTLFEQEQAFLSTEHFLICGASRRRSWLVDVSGRAACESSAAADNDTNAQQDPVDQYETRTCPETSAAPDSNTETSAAPDSDTDEQEDQKENWICHGCGASNSPERKRCAPPCMRWKGGSRNYAMNQTKKNVKKRNTSERLAKRQSSWSKSSSLPNKRQETRSSIIDNPAKTKNPYANLKRRDSPRQASKYHCGVCDACMVDDCGECRCCLDMKKFGGPWKMRQKCSSRPPCYNPPSKSQTKTSKSSAIDCPPASDLERDALAETVDGAEESTLSYDALAPYEKRKNEVITIDDDSSDDDSAQLKCLTFWSCDRCGIGFDDFYVCEAHKFGCGGAGYCVGETTSATSPSSSASTALGTPAGYTSSSTCGSDQDGGGTSPMAPRRMGSIPSAAAAAKAIRKGIASVDEELGEDWVCSTCQTNNPYERKRCQCPSTRVKSSKRLCAIPDCSKLSQGAAFNYMCKRHFTKSNDQDDGDGDNDGNDGVGVAIAKENSLSKKRSQEVIEPSSRPNKRMKPGPGIIDNPNKMAVNKTVRPDQSKSSSNSITSPAVAAIDTNSSSSSSSSKSECAIF